MATFRTDRDRRILGDRVVARKAQFCAMHAAAAEGHAIFVETHATLEKADNARSKETNEAQQARDTRSSEAADSLRLYAWAYNKLPDLLSPTWNAPVDPEVLEKTHKRLFPFGAPSTIKDQPQVILDALSTFLTQTALKPAIPYQAPFLAEAADKRDKLRAALAAVTTEGDEADAAVSTHKTARDTWDEKYLGLSELTSGLLRLQGKHDQHAHLFRPLPGGPTTSEDLPEPAPVVNPDTTVKTPQ